MSLYAELSIDCGLDDKYSDYMDPNTNLRYVSDGTFVDAGENHVVAAADADQAKNGRVDAIYSLRSFPSGKWNCYALPTATAATYLVRMQFLYGNYDNLSSSSVQFEIHLGSVQWDTVTVGLADTNATTKEAVFVAWAGWAPVCLVNTGRGTPFVSVVELRKLGDGLYPPVSGNQSMSMYDRRMMGTDAPVTRYGNRSSGPYGCKLAESRFVWTSTIYFFFPAYPCMHAQALLLTHTRKTRYPYEH